MLSFHSRRIQSPPSVLFQIEQGTSLEFKGFGFWARVSHICSQARRALEVMYELIVIFILDHYWL